MELQQKLSLRKHFITTTTSTGQTFRSDITRASFQAPEAFFKPSFLGISSQGLGQAITSLATSMDSTLRDEIFGVIHVSGGGSVIPGFVTRIRSVCTQELLQISRKPIITSFHDGEYDSWIGCSMFTQGDHYFQNAVSCDEYWETGSVVVNWKCVT
jgi:actin, other eukaryote